METPDTNRINTSLSALEDSSSLDRFMNTLSPLKPMKPAYIPPTFNSIFGCPSPTFSFVFKESRLVQCFRHDDPVETKKRRLSFEDETTICLVEEALAKSNSTELQDNAHQGVSVPDASIIAVDLTGDDGTEFPFGQPQEGSDCPPLLSDEEANSLLPLPAETVASHDANVPNGRQTNSVEGEPKSEGQELNWDSYIDNPTDDVLSFNPDEEIFRPPSMLNQVVDYMSVITQYLLNDESEVDPALPHPDERIAAAADRDHMQRCIGIGRELDQSNNGAQPGGEDLNRISPNPKRRRLNNLEPAAGTEGCKRCNCKKSKCLKFYCDCFASGTYCTGPCSCQNCFNQPIYKEIVLEARNKIMIQNPLAFASKIIINPADEIGSDPNKIPAPARHKKGCNCKKSSCIKNYCECYQSGVGCSERCRCEGCKNRFGRKDGCATSGT